MIVTFDDKTIDEPIGTGGPANGEPSWIDDEIEAIVRSTPFDTPSLEINNLTTIGNMGFELPALVNEGIVAVITDLWFYEDSDCWYTFGLYDSYGQPIAQIFFETNGLARITDTNGIVIEDVPYATGLPVPVLMAIDLETRSYSVWIDEVQRVVDRPLGASILDFQRVKVSAGYNCSDGNRFSIDQIRILGRVPPVPVETLSWGRLRALYR
jgi:hypothetical protein